MDGLVDLDELVTKCRDRDARKYIEEAVACYKAGAYRAAIVSTWVGVVYDFIAKLRQVALIGDPQAQSLLNEYEGASKSQDIARLLKFEREILDQVGIGLELISTSELVDLKRLYDDRNRCAHPIFSHDYEPYSPVAEVARYHIHASVAHVLSLPPAQGRRAAEIIWAKIGSDLFPTSKDRALVQLRSSPLLRARKALVRDVVQGLVTDLVKSDRDIDERERQIAALQAVLEMHRSMAEHAFGEKINQLLNQMQSELLPKVFVLMGRIKELPLMLDEASIQTCIRFVETNTLALSPEVIEVALRISYLKYWASKRLDELSGSQLASVIRRCSSPIPRPLVDAALSIYSESKTFEQTRWNTANLLRPVLSDLRTNQIKHILNAACANRQIYDEKGFGDVYTDLLAKTDEFFLECSHEWKSLSEWIPTTLPWDNSASILQSAIQGRLTN